MFKLFTGYTFIYLVAVIMSMSFEGAAGPISTRLDGAIDDEDLTITVDSVTGFVDPAGNFDRILYLGNEVVFYNDISGLTFTGMTRGQMTTKAARHSDNTIVYNEAAGTINNLAIYNLGEQLEEIGSLKGAFNASFALVAAVPAMLTWDYAYLEGTNQFIRMFLMLFSIGFVAQLIAMFVGIIRGIFT